MTSLFRLLLGENVSELYTFTCTAGCDNEIDYVSLLNRTYPIVSK